MGAGLERHLSAGMVSLETLSHQKKQIAYLYPMNSAHKTFAYHWHNRWDKPILKGSPAETMESIYAEKLGLTL